MLAYKIILTTYAPQPHSKRTQKMAITEKRLKLKIRSDMMAGIRQFNLITTGDNILISCTFRFSWRC